MHASGPHDGLEGRVANVLEGKQVERALRKSLFGPKHIDHIGNGGGEVSVSAQEKDLGNLGTLRLSHNLLGKADIRVGLHRNLMGGDMITVRTLKIASHDFGLTQAHAITQNLQDCHQCVIASQGIKKPHLLEIDHVGAEMVLLEILGQLLKVKLQVRILVLQRLVNGTAINQQNRVLFSCRIVLFVAL